MPAVSDPAPAAAAPAAPASAPAPAATATPAPSAANPPSATPAAAAIPAAAQPANPAAPAGVVESKSLLADAPAKTGEAAPAKTGEAAPVAAPAKTGEAEPEFKLAAPDKSPLPASTLGKVTEWAKAAKVPQAEAQKIVDALHTEAVASAVASAEAGKAQAAKEYAALYDTWGGELKADKEFGGEHLPKTLDAAKRTLRQFATVEERAFLESSPFGNHPILVRILARAGARLGEDSFIGGGANPAPAKTSAQIAYGADHTKPSSFR